MTECNHEKLKVYETERSVFLKCAVGHKEYDRMNRLKGIGYPVFIIRKELDKQKVIM